MFDAIELGPLFIEIIMKLKNDTVDLPNNLLYLQGEYYLDRDTGNLYMWFPEGDGNIKSSDVIYVSMVPDCVV